MSIRKAIFFLFAVAGAVALASCGKADAVAGATAWDEGQAAEAVAVEALRVTRGALVEDVGASGVVAGVREAWAVSETQGIVKSAGFSLGDRVTEGQDLLRVDDRIATLNLERFRDVYESARLELEATEKLSASGRSSPADLTRARGNASAAKAQYETALKSLNDTRVRAPISGVVASREDVATVGATVGPGSRVARIVDTSSFRITVGVGEREVGLLEQGAAARVFVPSALGDESVDGVVEAIAAGSNPGTGSFQVVVSFRNGFSGRVKSGMSANVSIRARATDPAIVVPSAALLRRGSTWAVFVESNGRAAIREVSVGRRSGIKAEILSGLAVDEIIVLSALTRLRPGTPIMTTVVGDSAGWE